MRDEFAGLDVERNAFERVELLPLARFKTASDVKKCDAFGGRRWGSGRGHVISSFSPG